MDLSLLHPNYSDSLTRLMEEDKPYESDWSLSGAAVAATNFLRANSDRSSSHSSPTLPSTSIGGQMEEQQTWPTEPFNDLWNPDFEPSGYIPEILSGFETNWTQSRLIYQQPQNFQMTPEYSHQPNMIDNHFNYHPQPNSSYAHSSVVHSHLSSNYAGSNFPPIVNYQPVPTAPFSSQSICYPFTDFSFAMPPARKTAQPRKQTGGRRPKDNENTRGLSKEEKEKRDLRRERNKQAAARCRQRRQNKLDTLQEEVNGLEKVTTELNQEIKNLEAQKSELGMILESHKSFCKLDPSLLPISTDLTCSQTSSCFVDEFHGGHNDLNVQLNETVGVDLDYKMDSKPELEEPQPKRFKGGEPISERSPPEAKVRPNTLGLGVKTTDMSPPGMFISATPSLGLSTDTPSKLIFQCDPLVTKLLQGSTGMTPINPAIQPFWETSVTASLDTPINAPTESVAGSTTGGTATSTTASRTAELTRL